MRFFAVPPFRDEKWSRRPSDWKRTSKRHAWSICQSSDPPSAGQFIRDTLRAALRPTKRFNRIRKHPKWVSEGEDKTGRRKK